MLSKLSRSRSTATTLVLALLMACHLFLSVESCFSNFVMLDEYAHVPAGMRYLQSGRFDIYRENPPFIQSIVAIPAILSGAKTDYSKIAGPRSEWAVGIDFLQRNVEDLRLIFGRCRIMVLLFGLTGAMLIFWWTRETAGPAAGLVCAALWILDPTILAFDSAITCDVGSAVVGGLATYGFCKYLRQPTWARSILSGIMLGLAVGSKFTMLLLIPAWIPWILLYSKKYFYNNFLKKTSAMLIAFIVVINILYLCDGSCSRLDSFEFTSSTLSALPTTDVTSPPQGNRFRGTVLGHIPVPFPSQLVLGLDSQNWESQVGLRYLGRDGIRTGGDWYSPLVTLAYKLPVGTIIIIVSALIFAPIAVRGSSPMTLVPATAAAFLLAAICFKSGLNWPVRYSIPIFFLAIVAMGPSVAKAMSHRAFRFAFVLMLIWNGVEIARVRPHYLSYANTFAGGPAGGQRLLNGSNYDWGQDLYGLEQWVVKHDEARTYISYYGAISPGILALPRYPLPRSFLSGGVAGHSPEHERPQLPFFWAVSSNYLNGMSCHFNFDDGTNPYGIIRPGRLDTRRAIARIGYSIYIFMITSDRASPRDMTIPFDDLEGCISRHEPSRTYIDSAP
jgi:dolichyl-phosphate-mannose-protein mannosyltransferase